MGELKTIFTDPYHIFSIQIPSAWKLNEKDAEDTKPLYQFEISPMCIFQISCRPMDEHLNKIAESNKLVQQNSPFPNISFVEDYFEDDHSTSYTWMAWVGNYFFFALFHFDTELKGKRDVPLELMDIRMSLRMLRLHNWDEISLAQAHILQEAEQIDYRDIRRWRNPPQKFLASITDREQKPNRISGINFEPLQLYALLSSQISSQPNGFHDLLGVGKPLDNMIWWGFVLESDIGFIHVWRTPHVIEAMYLVDGEFDLEKFFNSNIQKYKSEIGEAIERFDRRTIYINHYQSYRQCVDTLWNEISELDLTLPSSPKGHESDENSRHRYFKELELFTVNSVKYHALAKSLVLNAAFKIESFLNLVIRIGCRPELRVYPEVLSKFTKQDFSFRIKNIGFYTQILVGDVDTNSDVYRKTRELMTLRNKYVHYDEDATHNKLGEVFYDRDIPLIPIVDNRPAVETAINTFHHPDMATVRNAFNTSNEFITMFEALFAPKIKSELILLISQNPIGFNEMRGVYSGVYMPMSLDFFMG